MEMNKILENIEYLEKSIADWKKEIEECIQEGVKQEIIDENMEHVQMLIKSLEKFTQMKNEADKPAIKVNMTVKVELKNTEIIGVVTKISDNDLFYLVDENGDQYKFYTDINKVTIIEEGAFSNRENVEVVNPYDIKFYNKAYLVSLHNYDQHFFGVYANCEGDALDMVVDHLDKIGNDSYFYTLHDAMEYKRDGDSFITAGNFSRWLDCEHIYIMEVE